MAGRLSRRLKKWVILLFLTIWTIEVLPEVFMWMFTYLLVGFIMYHETLKTHIVWQSVKGQDTWKNRDMVGLVILCSTLISKSFLEKQPENN